MAEVVPIDALQQLRWHGYQLVRNADGRPIGWVFVGEAMRAIMNRAEAQDDLEQKKFVLFECGWHLDLIPETGEMFWYNENDPEHEYFSFPEAVMKAYRRMELMR